MKKSKLIGASALALLTLSLSGCSLDSLFGCTHKWDAWEIIEDPTCSDRGYKERECSLCGQVQSRSIRTDRDAHRYIENPDGDKEATCTSTGITGSMICSYCGTKKAGEETGFSGHKLVTAPDEVQQSNPKYKEATCEESGLVAKKCTVCEEIIDETIPAKGHNVVVDPVKNGVVSTLKCSGCSEIYGYELEVSDAAGWNKSDTKMNGTSSPSNTSSWQITDLIPSGTYNVELEAKLTSDSHGVRKFYNMANADLIVDGDTTANGDSSPDTSSQDPYRYTIKVDGNEFVPQTKESWTDLGLNATESNCVQFVDGVEIKDDSNVVQLCHGSIGYSLICSKIRLLKHVHENNEKVVAAADGKVGYKINSCSCGYTKITIDATTGTFADGKANKEGTPEGYIKLAANGDSISYKFDIEDNLIGNVYLVGREDNYPANAAQNPYNFEVSNGSANIAFTDNTKTCGDLLGTEADANMSGYSAEGAILVGETTLDAFDSITLSYKRTGSYNISVSKIVFEGRPAGHIHHYSADPSKTIAGTCQTSGYDYLKCSCGAGHYNSTGTTAHTYAWNTIDPTCTEDGKREQKCTVCGKVNKSIIDNAFGHEWGEDTFVKDGKTYHRCSTCGEEEEVTVSE